ncbi:MAG: deoxyribonuclease IV [Chloroflexi bacterium]|nr:deoxyribonuclease IV [Chloroflexota bacterium]
MRLGAHTSVAGGVDRAFARAQGVGCETMQIFTKSPNQWQSRPLGDDEIQRFRSLLAEKRIWPVVAHDAYLINLGSPDEEMWRRSVEALADELNRCQALGIAQLVMHPGAHMGAGEAAGLRRIADGLNEALAKSADGSVQVLLEVTAGQGSALGYRFEHLAQLIAWCDDAARLGVCFDTCHALAAGYELRTAEGYAATFLAFHETLGLDRLQVFHFNDCKRALGSRVDRHEHIGRGELGLEPFRRLLNDPRFRDRPGILETPKGPEMDEDRENLATLRSLVANKQD